jgi:hypothetical protein
MSDRRYLRPTAMDRAFNAVLAFVMRMGVSVYGSRVLAVRGRKSVAWRTVPVNQHSTRPPFGDAEPRTHPLHGSAPARRA